MPWKGGALYTGANSKRKRQRWLVNLIQLWAGFRKKANAVGDVTRHSITHSKQVVSSLNHIWLRGNMQICQEIHHPRYSSILFSVFQPSFLVDVFMKGYWITQDSFLCVILYLYILYIYPGSTDHALGSVCVSVCVCVCVCMHEGDCVYL